MSKIVSKAVQNYRNKNNNKNGKKNQNNDVIGNEWTDNGILASEILHSSVFDGSGKSEIDYDHADIKQDINGNIIDFEQHV